MIPLVILASYLVGSVPVGWLLARVITGKDLRLQGSGNIGVMNSAFSVARWVGFLVFLTEGMKGMAAVLMARTVSDGEIFISVTVLAAVVGARWTIWLRGAGGRGNTAGAGAILLIDWPILPITLAIWSVVRLLTGRSFVATRVNLLSWPLVFYLVTRSWPYTGLGAALAVLYLSAQQHETDDHSRINERWPSFWAFLTGPRRHNARHEE